MNQPSERTLLDRSPIGMYRVTQSGRLLYANAALARLLAYDSVEALLKVNVERDIYVDAAERTAMIDTHRPLGVVDGARATWKTRDGRHLLVQVYGQILEPTDPGGEVTFHAWVLDVTDFERRDTQQREHAEELARVATILEIVVRQVSAIWWIVDRDLRIQRTGGAVLEILGYPPDKYIGWTLLDVVAQDPAPNDESIPSHYRALAGEIVTYISDYRGRQLQNTLAPLRIGGEIVGVIGTNIDVTGPRTLERRMVDAQRAESLGVLAGGLAHDFNNLLVAILGNADLGLRDTQPGAPGHAALENIRNASLRAAELTNQLLAYAGRGGVSSTRVKLGPLVEELLRIWAPRVPADVRVEVDIRADLGIRGDAAQVRQVLLNLISNARDAVAPRGGRIVIRTTPIYLDGSAHTDDVLTATAGHYVALEVADDGPGMDRDTRRKIFDPFFTTKPDGHGLGLAAILGIVRTYGGGLRLITEPGGGARFVVLWPAATTPAAVPTLQSSTRTILVIDDEDLVRDVIARMIVDLGYTALTAADGASGLDIVESETVHAVFVDLTMPRMSGAEVVAKLRAKHPALPIVLCSGYDRDRHGPVDATAYLPKPFRIEALEQILAKLLP